MRFTVHVILFVFITISFLASSCKSDHQQIKSVGDSQNIDNNGKLLNTKKTDAIEEDVAWEGDIKLDTITKKEVVQDNNAEKEIDKKAKAKVSPKKKKPAKKKPKPKKKLSKIVFEELEFDFGKIDEGDTIKHNFVFTNDSDVALEVISANATCGCTRPSFPFIPIESGEQGYIGVEYISINKEGDQKPEITITSNGSAQPIVLHLIGYVTPKPKEEKAVKLDTLTPVKLPNKG